MASEREWAESYHLQALADLKGASVVQGAEASVLAMLLQMVFEKLGKAALLRSGMMTVQRAEGTHQAATTMMQVIGGSRRKCTQLGFHREYVRQVLTPMVGQLESLNPSVVRRRGGTGPWLEYPWLDPNDNVRCPCRDLPVLEAYRPRSGARAALLFDLARALADRFNQVFG